MNARKKSKNSAPRLSEPESRRLKGEYYEGQFVTEEIFQAVALLPRRSLQLHCNVLPHAGFGGTHYSLYKTGVMNGVTKAGCGVGARTHITDKMRVDLSNVNRCAHEATGDPGRLGRWECHV